YVLTARNGHGRADKTLTIHATPPVLPAKILSFSAQPSQVAPGVTVTLRWSLSGEVAGVAVSGAPPLAETATSVQVTPSATATHTRVQPATTTVYTLTARGPTGSDSRQLTLTVSPSAGSSFSYAPPGAGSEAVRLLAKACAAPCTQLELQLVAAQALQASSLA